MTNRPDQPTIHWGDAAAVLASRIREIAARLGPGSSVAVGITGPVGSGKTTLAGQLGGTLVSTDHYLPDYHTLPEQERDEPGHADLPALAQHLTELKAGRAVEMPLWCFQSHRRVGARRVEPAELIVCEGIFALHATVRETLDLAVFVDAPRATRWARWEQIEAAGERGWGVERAKRYFAEVADPTFARHADTYRRVADIVVLNHAPPKPRPKP
ncbi:MAG: hypothetical protein Q9O74_10025 [Planctomycetota bacterium]|nr:hypothetical protein [Planctomycetota bacterium]